MLDKVLIAKWRCGHAEVLMLLLEEVSKVPRAHNSILSFSCTNLDLDLFPNILSLYRRH